MKALECCIPVYTFINSELLDLHYLYQKNPIINEKKEFWSNSLPEMYRKNAIKSVFCFIDIIRKRGKGNSYYEFSSPENILEILKIQWSGLFKILLCESRKREMIQNMDSYIDNNYKDDLLTKNNDIADIYNGSGENKALIIASAKGYYEIVKHLVSAGTCVNVVDENNGTPLLYAAWFGHYDIVKFLIKMGAKINVINNSGESPPSLAKSEGHNDIASVLSHFL